MLISYSPFRLPTAQDSTDQHLAVDDPCLEGTKDCPDPHGEALHLFTAAADVLPKSSMKDKPRSPHITAAAAAAPSRRSEVRTGGEVGVGAGAASVTSALDDAAGPRVAEADGKHEWEMRGVAPS